jgi:hypothetical protein
VVKLRGLPFSAVEEQVQHFIESQLAAAGVTSAWPRVQLLRNRDGRASGFAHVHFAKDEDVDTCQRVLHLSMFGDRYVEAFIRKSTGPPPPRRQSAVEAGVVVEIAAFLSQRPGGCALLSELGVSLSEQGRAALRHCGGLKQVIEHTPHFSLAGVRGAEMVQLLPDPCHFLRGSLDAAGILAAANAVASFWPVAAVDACGSSEDGSFEPTKVRLRGLPFSATEDDVRGFLSENGALQLLADVDDAVRVQRRNNGRPTGNAVLLLKSVSPQKVIDSLHGKHMGDRYIEVLACDEK